MANAEVAAGKQSGVPGLREARNAVLVRLLSSVIRAMHFLNAEQVLNFKGCSVATPRDDLLLNVEALVLQAAKDHYCAIWRIQHCRSRTCARPKDCHQWPDPLSPQGPTVLEAELAGTGSNLLSEGTAPVQAGPSPAGPCCGPADFRAHAQLRQARARGVQGERHTAVLQSDALQHQRRPNCDCLLGCSQGSRKVALPRLL
mmetsp:Transcript_61618/g.127539  ORF Transcript_61618/g.127539 Transcript_61618/m.127539 type:complete len:201 (-) Transcript_61618:130-732(-)